MTSRPEPPESQLVVELEETEIPKGLTGHGVYGYTKPKLSDKERRFLLAGRLLLVTVLFGAVLIVAAVLAPPDAWERIDRVAVLVLVPFQTLLGTAVGWYFGQSKRGN